VAIHVFGIRHHGPGCARSLLAALEDLQPDIVLVEGPPDARDVLPLLTDEAMRPPVALLIYAAERPQDAAFYPFTTFSPEWQALRYALGRGVPARFMDLPQAIRMEGDRQAPDGHEPEPASVVDQPAAVNDRPMAATMTAPPPDLAPDVTPEQQTDGAATEETDATPTDVPEPATPDAPDDVDITERANLRDDPIGMLAEAAGYEDHELWWEHQIEQRQDATSLFEGILEAMTALRADRAEPQGMEALREAHMRQTIRAARKEGFGRVAVVCGAWHAPLLTAEALDAPDRARDDAALLSGGRRVKVQATWIPWTNSRLSYRSGYGAGVRSPGWYEHLWTAPDRHAIRWVTRIAHLLRENDLDASSANIIEAVRLGEALAAMRDLPMPGLAELHEAAQTVLCSGNPAPMALIRDRLEIGERLGEVPERTPAVPLQVDLSAQQRRLKLKPTAEQKMLDLDLRKETDLARSHLLHRLSLLGIAWGKPQGGSGGKGTFHELWQLQWQPELAVQVVEASVWGNTVEAAAVARVTHDAAAAGELPRLTLLLDGAILAALPRAVTHLLDLVREQAAVAADVRHLMDALPPLARVARYGDVRGSGAAEVGPVIAALFERVVVGLPGACGSLDDDAAEAMSRSIANVQETVGLLDVAEQRAGWQGVLRWLVEREGVHGLVRGWCCRLLLEVGALDSAELQRLARLALSPAVPPAQAAAWLEGTLRGSGLLLLQQDGLWQALDGWLRDLQAETFVELLPLIRRAFSGFQPPERHNMGDKVKRLAASSADGQRMAPAGEDDVAINRERADLVLPVLARILGMKG